MPDAASAVVAALSSALTRDGQEALRLLGRGHNVVLYGPPGTGKTHASMSVRDHWLTRHGPGSVVLTTFHPAYSYEDFVQGFRPDKDDPSTFKLVNGVLLEAAEIAQKQPTLLVIDEINRADVARVFGELITFIERDKRGIPFTTAQDRDELRAIPEDLYVLGTMNTADKSISLLDVALRRRFRFIACQPDGEAFANIPEWAAEVDGVDLGLLLTTINQRLLSHGVEPDRLVGHAILAVPAPGSLADLSDRLRYDVIPLVEEYLFGDRARVAEVLPGLFSADGVRATIVTEDVRELAGLPRSQPSVDAETHAEQDTELEVPAAESEG